MSFFLNVFLIFLNTDGVFDKLLGGLSGKHGKEVLNSPAGADERRVFFVRCLGVADGLDGHGSDLFSEDTNWNFA